jgi:signal transduction histidine kinase
MRERVLQFAGNVAIDSDPSGTRVMVTIPLGAQSIGSPFSKVQAAV